ncbi:MAG: DNA translocase FtsK [Chloroflexi bacterium]|nr:DNA translocase FtsK [Chloroflexota bacterium]
MALAVLVLLGPLALAWGRPFLVDQAYPAARDATLRLVGLGIFPLGTWLLALALAARLRPQALQAGWRWWLASALLLAALQGALGAVHGPTGVMAQATLGGMAGQAVWGGALPRGAATVALLCILAALVLQPRWTARGGLAGTRWGLVGSIRLLRWTLRTCWSALHLLGRKRAEAWALAGRGAPEEYDPFFEEPQEGQAGAPHHPPHGAESGASPLGDGAAASARRLVAQRWKLPTLDFLEPPVMPPALSQEHEEVAQQIEEALGHHGVEVSVEQIKPGPTVTLYGLAPGWVRRRREMKERDHRGNLRLNHRGRPLISEVEDQTRVKVDSIVAREKDLALALAAPSLRIQAPVPGESVVGIEVPNRDPLVVTLRSVIETPEFRSIARKGGLPLALGLGPGGDPVAVDLRSLPHLLVAGTTGSGKSVCLNALIVALASQVPPERLRLLLVDPKRVELTPFNGLPHLVVPVVVDVDRVVRVLKGMLKEMFRRYRCLEEAGARNIEAYHRQGHGRGQEPMPYVVVAVDELADIMMAAPYEVEQTLCRLAQLGRATGIHLVVATQRPSVDVVTGLIKANFPSRISFAVVSQVDSRTILDSVGAERLLGKGDMLFLSTETPRPQRIQGVYVSDEEIPDFMQFWRSQSGPPLPPMDLEPDPSAPLPGSARQEEMAADEDDLVEKARELAARYKRVSTSLLQRRLRIGYPRAARLMDRLEDEGIVAPGTAEAGKPRDVL